jgi:hypothetical protein
MSAPALTPTTELSFVQEFARETIHQADLRSQLDYQQGLYKRLPTTIRGLEHDLNLSLKKLGDLRARHPAELGNL